MKYRIDAILWSNKIKQKCEIDKTRYRQCLDNKGIIKKNPIEVKERMDWNGYWISENGC